MLFHNFLELFLAERPLQEVERMREAVLDTQLSYLGEPRLHCDGSAGENVDCMLMKNILR